MLKLKIEKMNIYLNIQFRNVIDQWLPNHTWLAVAGCINIISFILNVIELQSWKKIEIA